MRFVGWDVVVGGVHAPCPCPTSAHTDNGISEEGGKAIGKALEVNAVLTSLNLRGACCRYRKRDGLCGGLRVWLVFGMKGIVCEEI